VFRRGADGRRCCGAECVDLERGNVASVQAASGAPFAGVDAPRDAVGDGGRFDWGVGTTQRNLQKKGFIDQQRSPLSLRSVALDRVRGRNRMMVRVRRYYHGGFGARIACGSLRRAQTSHCGCRPFASDVLGGLRASKSHTGPGRNDAREKAFQTARARRLGQRWMQQDMAVRQLAPTRGRVAC
jgi:hypothetical protein